MNVKSVLSNASIAFLAQGVAMLIAAFQSLIIPKFLGVSEYGYWQLFIFYSNYVGFFHLGLADGVYLLYGGISRDEIDKKSVNSQFVFGLAFQCVLSIVVIMYTVFCVDSPERNFILIWTCIFMVIKNSATFLGYILQAMNETKRFSYSAIIEKLVFFGALLILLISHTDNFESYILAYVFGSICQLALCLYYARDFIASGFDGWKLASIKGFGSIKVGINLMIATIASSLILGVARFIVDQFWGIETFGKLSLSLSMMNFFAAFVSQGAMVLFPALRQSRESEITKFYHSARDLMILVFPALYLLYFPIVWLLGIWLPEYSESLKFFALLLPICVFDSKMDITCTTLFKVRREEKLLFRLNIVICVISGLISLLSAHALGRPEVVIGSAAICLIARSLWAEHHFNGELNVPKETMSIMEIAITVLFVAFAFTMPLWMAMGAYCLVYVIFLSINFKRLKELLSLVLRITRSNAS